MQYDPLVKLIPTCANPKAMLKWHLGDVGYIKKAVVVVVVVVAVAVAAGGGGGGGGGGGWRRRFFFFGRCLGRSRAERPSVSAGKVKITAVEAIMQLNHWLAKPFSQKSLLKKIFSWQSACEAVIRSNSCQLTVPFVGITPRNAQIIPQFGC